VQIRAGLRLRGEARSLESEVAGRFPSTPDIAVNVVVIQETINGRPYVIEVLPVGRARWRAHLARRGATTALMPFYGATPEEAAGQLMRWLARASGHVPVREPVREKV
jgi:hypothetical protein